MSSLAHSALTGSIPTEKTDGPADSITDRFYALRVDLWGDKGADAYADAIDALHLFAQATDCMPGGSVVRWFDEQCDRLTECERQIMAQRRSTRLATTPNPDAVGTDGEAGSALNNQPGGGG